MKRYVLLIMVVLTLFSACDAILPPGDGMSGMITTVAGNGEGGSWWGQICPALSAGFQSQYVAVDSKGNVYGTYGSYIFKVDSSGIIAPYAGNGTQGFWGDGVPALQAQLSGSFTTIAVDASDNLYIADAGNYRLRKVNTAGMITTVAGNGTPGYSEDGTLAVNAQLYGPVNISIDSFNNIFFTESFAFNEMRIRKIDNQGYLTTVAGGGTTYNDEDGILATTIKLRPITAMAVDPAGNIYIPQYCFIRKIDTNGFITTIAGEPSSGGCFWGENVPALSAWFTTILGLTTDAHGNLFIADTYTAYRVRKIDENGIITTVAGNGKPEYIGDYVPATSAQIYPESVAVDPTGNIYIADSTNCRVYKVWK